ncbi:MAG: lectin-like domain-containing protein [Planctomycetota bacterium]
MLRRLMTVCVGFCMCFATTVASADFDYPNFSSVAGLNLLGTAQQTGSTLRLTQSVGQQIGGCYRVDQENFAGGFDTSFSFQCSGPPDGADGFTFILQAEGPDALQPVPFAGSTLGYATATVACGYASASPGITSSLVVEFDTWDSGPCFGEPGTARHVAVQSNGIDPNTGRWDDRLGGEAGPTLPNFENGAVHVARVLYDPSVPVLRVYLDDLVTPLFDVIVDISALLQTSNAWLGFTGTTGGVVSTYTLLNWSFVTSTIPYSYDDCVSAITMQIGDTCDFTTTAATASGLNPGCGGVGNPLDAWFSFQTVCDGDYRVSLCGSAFDTRLAIFNGTGGCPTIGSTPVACNDNAAACGGSASEIVLTAGAGETYFVQVGGAGTLAGTGSISVQQLSGVPTNDLCSTPAIYAGATTFNTACAGSEGVNPGCGSAAASPDIWFQYTVVADSIVTASLAGSLYNTVIGVWGPTSGCPTVGSVALACNDNAVGLGTQSLVEFSALAGEVFLLQVTGFSGASGAGSLEISEFVPPDVTGLHLVIDGDTGGAVDSTSAIVAELMAASITPTVLDFDQAFMGTPAAVYYIGGTFPANTTLTTNGLGATLRDLILAGANAYVAGGDIWGFDAETVFGEVDGINTVATVDGADNHDSGTGAAGGPLDGVTLAYTQDQAGNDWTDELVTTATDTIGDVVEIIFLDDATGGGGVGATYAGQQFPVLTFYDTLAPNGKVVCGSTEIGGYTDPSAIYGAIAALFGGGAPPIDTFKRGDANGDGTFNIADAVFLLGALFVPGSPAVQCQDAADANDDGLNNIADAVSMLSSLFVPGSMPPPAPGPTVCGPDPSADALACATYPPCP